MLKEDCYFLGHLSRTHGLGGELVAVLDTDVPERYTNLESVFVEIRGELVPFFIESITLNSKGHFILQFEDIDAESAPSLVNRELYLPLEFLPPLEGKQFYYHEVIGFSVYDQDEAFLGTCREVKDNAAQPLFAVESEQGKEMLIPAVDDFIVSIDRNMQRLDLQIPDGLKDLYLEP